MKFNYAKTDGGLHLGSTPLIAILFMASGITTTMSLVFPRLYFVLFGISLSLFSVSALGFLLRLHSFRFVKKVNHLEQCLNENSDTVPDLEK